MATSVELSDDLEARIAKLSGQRRLSPEMIVDEAVQQYVEREEAKDSFRQEADASWAEFKATGLHLTGDEARALASYMGDRRGDGTASSPRLIITAGAARGLERCRAFLAGRNKPASERARRTIESHFARLETHPEIGRPFRDAPELRELVIPFGDSGYATLYHFDSANDAVKFVYRIG